MSTRSPTGIRDRTCSRRSRPRSTEAEASAGQPGERVAAAISFGALMGARGNSGRHHEPDLPRHGRRDRPARPGSTGSTWRTRSSEGARTAYGAVAKPVEGTILTVIRESAAAAVTAAERDARHREASWRRPSTPPKVRRIDADPARRSSARPASSIRAGRACIDCSRARSCTSLDRRPRARRAEGDPRRRQAVDARGPRRRGLRLRDDVPPPGATGPAARRRRDPRPARDRSASRCSSPATPGRSRSMSTTSGPTSSSATGSASAR